MPSYAPDELVEILTPYFCLRGTDGCGVLDYDAVEVAGPVSTNAAAAEDMAGVSVSVTVGQNALVLLELVGATYHADVGEGGYVQVTDSANAIVSNLAIHYMTGYQTISCIGYKAVAAGTHTFKGRFFRIVGGDFAVSNIRLQAIAFAR